MAEQALWKFVEEEKPSFTVTNFMPPLIFGPMEQKVASAEKINFSNSQIQSIMNSAKAEGGKVPSTMFPGYVSLLTHQRRSHNADKVNQIDVRDLAELQILALTTPGAANKRFVVGFPMMFNRFAEALRNVPELKSRIGENNDDDTTLAPARFDTSEADAVFQFKFRTLDETAKDIAANILKVEAA